GGDGGGRGEGGGQPGGAGPPVRRDGLVRPAHPAVVGAGRRSACRSLIDHGTGRRARPPDRGASAAPPGRPSAVRTAASPGGDRGRILLWPAMVSAAVTKGRGSTAGWLFEGGRCRPLTPMLLAQAGLVWEPLAAVRLSLARAVPAGTWHITPAAGEQFTGCPRLRRITGRGRSLERRDVGLLAGAQLCGTCASK